MAFQRDRSSRRFIGSSRISRARSSAWSLRKLSSRAASSRPSSTAARPGQPGLVRPELELPQPRRVQEESTAREENELAVAGGVAAALVGLQDLAGLLP